MMFQKNKILFLAAMGLLFAFLAFWIYGEFTDEVQGLKNEAYLEVATKIIDFQGEDFFGIIQEFENKDVRYQDMEIKIDTFISITEDERGGKQEIRHSIGFAAGYESDSDLPFFNEEFTRDSGSNIKIILTDQSSGMLGDSATFNFDVDSNFRQDLKKEFQEKDKDVKLQAMMNIWPQIIFAIILWFLFLIGFIFLERGHRHQRDLLVQKNNFISNITHELKTPLSTMGIALEAIENYYLDDKEKTVAYLRESRNQISHLDYSIDQLMHISKMDNVADMFMLAPVNVHELITHSIESLAIPFEKKGMTIKYHCEDKELTAKLDSYHFKNVVFNLLDNALKYSKENTKVSVHLVKVSDQVFELRVQDEGIGIDTHHQQKIFDRFYRIPNGNIHNVRGNGLGLSYVKAVIEAHNGRIKVESKSQEGSTFIIKCPVKDV